jgi:PIN domain-containing protein
MGLSIYDGFEGYRQPKERELSEALASGSVVLDANVLLSLYGFPQPARELALKYLTSLKERLWVPNQVMREFWRNRHARILEGKNKSNTDPLDAARQNLLSVANQLRPDNQQTDEISELKSSIAALITRLQDEVKEAAGEPLQVAEILRDPDRDPVVQGLTQILDGRIGSPFEGQQEKDMIKEGLRRFADKIPPGYEDGTKKKDQRPECGTGDFLLWEQTLRYMQDEGSDAPFVIVTGDEKSDWRMQGDGKTFLLGARPELVVEAHQRTGRQVYVVSPADFYSLMAAESPTDTDAQAAESLISTSEDQEVGSPGTGWPRDAYIELLQRLKAAGYRAQALAIQDAAVKGGFIERAHLLEVAGYNTDRLLTRFSLPAKRLALTLAEEGYIDGDASPPLNAIYDGPGRAIGYEVPKEFVSFEASDTEDSAEVARTWLQAAVEAASKDVDKEWSVSELVEQIKIHGLRDLSNARTPEATLARDLRLRQTDLFKILPAGLYKLIIPEAE